MLTTNCGKNYETMGKKARTAKKRSTSRGIVKKSKFYRPRMINTSATLIRQIKTSRAKELTKKSALDEHHYALPAASIFLEDINRGSPELRQDKENSLKNQKTVVHDNHNVSRNDNEDFDIYEEKREIEHETESRELKNIPRDNLSLEINAESPRNEEIRPVSETINKRKQGITRVSKKLHHSRSRKKKKVSSSLVSRSNKNKKTRCVIEKSNETESTRENRDTAGVHKDNSRTRINGEKYWKNYERLREAISMSKRGKIIEKNVTKNDYEDSDIDESLLVDPSTDLPQSLVETIDDNIELSNAEFDVGRDLNFASNEPYLSNFVTLERDVFSNCHKDIVGILKRTSKGANIGEQLTKEVRFESRTLRESEKISLKKRRKSANDAIVFNNTLALRENQENNDNRETEITDTFGRVTRLSMRNSMALRQNDECRAIGTLVWGNCMGWWPGLIVDSADVGMPSKPEKSWICWIGEYRISHLRDKTQIQSFSTNLRQRMIDTLRSKSSGDLSYVACLETIKLVNDQILDAGPLTKPHHLWAEKHLMSLKKIDRLILYPYPPNVQPRLDQLRIRNVRGTERYLSDVREKAEKSLTTSKSSGKALRAKDIFVPVPGHLPLIEQKPGVITWAKIMGQVWWPAVVIDYRDWGMKEPSFGCQWIVWYGDYTISQVNHRFFLSFDSGIALMKEYAKNSKRECYRRGVLDACKDYCSRHGYRTENWQINDAIAWFESNDEENLRVSSSINNNVLPGIPGNFELSQRYPARMIQILRKHRGACTVAAAREHTIQDSESLRLVRACKMKIDELCLMCLESCEKDKDTIEHPFFVGKLCNDCTERYEPTIFAYGDDGKCFFCTICAGSDTVVMCDVDDCPRVYCTACVKYLVAPLLYDDIMLKDPWSCFVCDADENFTKQGLLKSRDDWKERVSRLFRSNDDSVPRHVERCKNSRRKIRVLSLFDGISAGLVVLKKLGIQIDVYYASEIEPDAEMISSAHHGQEIKRLGDVRTITEETIRKIGPIDLLIGGSPCNDLSLVNPLRLGLHDPKGTGILVFEYCRVKKLLETHNEEKHFFWLFENVASMPSKYRLEINQLLGRQPELIDSANYSPQHRPRLYWSNLPVVSFPLSTQDLQDVLTPNCNRRALVKKIRTVTTRINSLKQGRDALKPILMNETNDTLWITELEEIFGFPRHYTDVKNLCATKRQKLVAMSWSVQTIVEIMRPLCNFFRTRNDVST